MSIAITIRQGDDQLSCHVEHATIGRFTYTRHRKDKALREEHMWDWYLEDDGQWICHQLAGRRTTSLRQARRIVQEEIHKEFPSSTQGDVA